MGLGYGFTPEFRVDATYTYFDFDIDDPGIVAAGQNIVPNTPKHKGGVALPYTGLKGSTPLSGANSLRATIGTRVFWQAAFRRGRSSI